jgi:hypothetical protein
LHDIGYDHQQAVCRHHRLRVVALLEPAAGLLAARLGLGLPRRDLGFILRLLAGKALAGARLDLGARLGRWREVDSNPRSPCGGWRLGLKRSLFRVESVELTRFGPFSSQCRAGNINIRRGRWNEDLFRAIERVYLQGERNFPVDGSEEASGAMYRKALDIGLKKIDPTLTGTLGNKIKTLATAGKLTPDIVEWAGHVRDLGNEAVHEETPPSRKELEDLRGVTEMMLRYLFTLPNMIKKHRGEKLPWES